MKKPFIFIVLLLISMSLFSQDFFTGGNRNVYFNEALESLNSSVAEFTSPFVNNALKILLGEKDLLDRELDIFSLAQLNNEHLRLLRNMVYAKHGMRFTSQDLNSYFSRFSWYNPVHANVDNLLTNMDKQNIRLIQAFENRNENFAGVNLGDAAGVWSSMFYMASGWPDRFVIYPNNRLEFIYSQMRELRVIYGLNGRYAIRGNVLIFTVTEITFFTNDSQLDYSGAFGYDWNQSDLNTMVLQNPIEYRFSVSGITVTNNGGWPQDTLIIGGKNFYRLSTDVNDKN